MESAARCIVFAVGFKDSVDTLLAWNWSCAHVFRAEDEIILARARLVLPALPLQPQLSLLHWSSFFCSSSSYVQRGWVQQRSKTSQVSPCSCGARSNRRRHRAGVAAQVMPNKPPGDRSHIPTVEDVPQRSVVRPSCEPPSCAIPLRPCPRLLQRLCAFTKLVTGSRQRRSAPPMKCTAQSASVRGVSCARHHRR